MFGKFGFVLRSLFVTLALGSLVACTFEGGADEEQGSTTSGVEKGGDHADSEDDGDDEDAITAEGTDVPDASVHNDGGPYVHTDGGDGGWHSSADGGDGGVHYYDGGAYSDGGVHHDGGGHTDASAPKHGGGFRADAGF